jgi:ADP-ribosylglycohydrolase
MRIEQRTRIVNSVLWAAYGDALGFITELGDLHTLRYRTGEDSVTQTIKWKRRIGGRFGTVLELPAGCYSDDTQLRLSVSRSIGADGHFDVEAFAKIELPVWLSYSLGGGLSTKAAASSLVRENVNWFSNFFSSKTSSYFGAGGNGAAMRIQPHVWASSDASQRSTYMRSVVRNTISTHGHLNAIVGAYFHAACLGFVLSEKEIPGPDQWRQMVSQVVEISAFVQSDDELNSFWLPVWNQRSARDLEVSLQETRQEAMKDVEIIDEIVQQQGNGSYSRILRSLGALDPATRGSGIKTALVAAALSWTFRDRPISEALVVAANALGSDTDSIATMAGAILGANCQSPPEGALADRDYIVEEANRLYEVGRGDARRDFKYPDLMSWRAPKTLLTAVTSHRGQAVMAGLGYASSVGERRVDKKDKNLVWQWLKLEFGQTVLVRTRQTLEETLPENLIGRYVSVQGIPETRKAMSAQSDLFRESVAVRSREGKGQTVASTASLDGLTTIAINSGFNYDVIGRHIVDLSEQPNGVELVVAYSAIIAKARKARMRSRDVKGGTQ